MGLRHYFYGLMAAGALFLNSCSNTPTATIPIKLPPVAQYGIALNTEGWSGKNNISYATEFFQKQKFGSIMVLGQGGSEFIPHYPASKGQLEEVISSLAEDAPTSSIVFLYINSSLGKRIDDDFEERAYLPLDKPLSTQEFAECIGSASQQKIVLVQGSYSGNLVNDLRRTHISRIAAYSSTGDFRDINKAMTQRFFHAYLKGNFSGDFYTNVAWRASFPKKTFGRDLKPSEQARSYENGFPIAFIPAP